MHKILYIGYVWPEPNSSAAGSRTMEFLRLFRAQNWEVIFASPAALSEHRADLSSLQIHEKSIAVNCDRFDDFIRAYQPSMVVFDRYFTEEQFGWRVEKHCPQALRILESCDLHSLREARHQLLKARLADCENEEARYQVGPEIHSQDTLFSAMAQNDIAQREIAAIFRSDLSWIISSFEIRLLQDVFQVPAYLLCESNLMSVVKRNAQPDYAQRRHFLSIGNFRHQPNWDSVLWLKHAIWPRIRKVLPQAQLHVVGAYPPPKALALHNAQQGFHVLGWADDAQAVMASARVCLAPLRYGAGLKGKLADALACGTPSVTTSIGSEGMCCDMPWAGTVADTVEDFAQAACDLYSDAAHWQQSHQQCDQILQAQFCTELHHAQIVKVILEAIEHKQIRRLQNFTGSMLRHHLHKSTQYMSQWITLKNQGN